MMERIVAYCAWTDFRRKTRSENAISENWRAHCNAAKAEAAATPITRIFTARA